MASAAVAAHRRAQVLRFLRITALAFVPLLAGTGVRWPGWAAAWPLLAGAAEVVMRQYLPVKAIPAHMPPAMPSPPGPSPIPPTS